ncbi:MAG: DoxX family protein [Dysgonamonadaceae bacterium]|jgi:putative oxidoreductase|nr:DoxX family protein [Dysgonamonadaceae bacterium]
MKSFLNFIVSPSLSIDWLVFVRVFVGVLLIKHAIILFDASQMRNAAAGFDAMHIPLPGLMAYISKSTEFFGGLLLVIGLFTHITAAILVFNMFVALWTAFGFNIFKGEPAFLFLLLFIVFAVLGGGKYSCDYLIFRKPVPDMLRPDK